MDKIIFLIILLATSTVYAGDFACYNPSSTPVSNRFTNKLESIHTPSAPINCLKITRAKLNQITTLYKFDGSIIGSNDDKFILMTAQEQQDILDVEASAIEARQCVSINALNISTKEAFVAWLQVYNSKVPTSAQVSKTELKAQIISNKGIICP